MLRGGTRRLQGPRGSALRCRTSPSADTSPNRATQEKKNAAPVSRKPFLRCNLPKSQSPAARTALPVGFGEKRSRRTDLQGRRGSGARPHIPRRTPVGRGGTGTARPAASGRAPARPARPIPRLALTARRPAAHQSRRSSVLSRRSAAPPSHPRAAPRLRPGPPGGGGREGGGGACGGAGLFLPPRSRKRGLLAPHCSISSPGSCGARQALPLPAAGRGNSPLFSLSSLIPLPPCGYKYIRPL